MAENEAAGLGAMATVVDVSASKEVDASSSSIDNQGLVEEAEWAVEDFYSTVGVWQAVARKAAFKNVMTAFTAMFMVCVGIDMDSNDSATLGSAHAIFQIMTMLFFLVFSFDVAIRIQAFKRKSDILKVDSMLVFETILTALLFLYILLGIGIGGSPDNGMKLFLKLLYIWQLTRMARLVKEMPELLILVKGVFVAARSVFFTILLMAILLYCFSLCLRSFFGDTKFGERYFPTVPAGEWTLLLKLALFQGLGEFLEEAKEESVALTALLLVALLSIASVLFMCIGVLLEVIKMVSIKEKDVFVCKYLVAASKSIVRNAVGEECIDSGMNQVQIDKLFSNLQFLEFLTGCFKQSSFFSTGAMGLDLVDLKDLVLMQFESGKRVVTIKQLMGLVVELSGPNAATMKSMLRLRQCMSKQQ